MMKKEKLNLSIHLLPLLAAIGVLITACNSDDENEGTIIKPIVVDGATTEFLNAELPVCSYIHYSYGFFNSFFSDTCYVINSIEELKSKFDETLYKLPELNIDFAHNSLIVGQHKIKEQFVLPVNLDSQAIIDKDDVYTLKLYYNMQSDCVDLGIEKVAYFWGVYPKLSKKKVVVNFNWNH